MRGSLVFIALVFLFGCKKKQDFSTVSVNGHAGMGLKFENSIYHDNSLEAIELALSIEGCDGVEIDVQLSEDNELYLFHDAELTVETTGSGCINDLLSTEIDSYRYSTLHKEKIAKLKDLDMAYCKGKNVFLDIRHLNACSNSLIDKDVFIQKLLEVQILQSTEVKYFMILSNPDWIASFSSAGFNTLLSVSENDDKIELLTLYPQLDGVMSKNLETSSELIDQIHVLDKKVFIFEIRSPKGIRTALKKYPDGLITDDIRTTLIEKY